ncbi:MAG: ATP synthase F0 subunit B [Desulfatitalea sp.]|nr:ATP synthase F0 subunit B [Desulfatitalea sp.]NNK01068.1 ATP synthase F0 subunit B [Desulfatitalea sp.]
MGCIRKRKTGCVVFVLVVAVMLATAWTPAWASGAEGGHGEVHWQKTDWFRVLNFAVLAIGLFLLLRKPASQALNSRIKGISQELEALEARKAEAEKQLTQYNEQLGRLEAEAEQIVNEYIRQGQDAKARILKEAEETADKLKEQAQNNIEHEFKQAKLLLQEHVVERALAKAEQLIVHRISPDDQNRLVDDYLGKVVA